MKKMQIVVSDFEAYKHPFPIGSVLYIECDNRCFPDYRWVDLTSEVLEMWLKDMIGLLYSANDQVNLNFMDGDYSLRLTLCENDSINAIWIESKKEIAFFDTIDLLHFCRQLLTAATHLMNHAQKEGDQQTAYRISEQILTFRNAYQKVKQTTAKK